MKRVSFRNKTKRSCTDRNIGESTSLKEGLRDKALVAGISLGPGGNRYIIIQGSRLYSWRRTPRNWGEFAPRPCRNAASPSPPFYLPVRDCYSLIYKPHGDTRCPPLLLLLRSPLPPPSLRQVSITRSPCNLFMHSNTLTRVSNALSP